MATLERTGVFPQPCAQLAIEIGQVMNQIEHASPAQLPQLERQLGQLQARYHQQCGQSGSGVHHPLLNLQFVRGTALFNVITETGNEVRVIFGGNDGILITIDGAGHIHVYPPQGPGDPELRQAVTSIIAGMQTLTGKLGGVAQQGAAAA
jgi:hypothetical protein